MDNTVGAIGFVSRIIPAVYPISIIKVDADGEPIRNSKGLCQVCKPSRFKKWIILSLKKKKNLTIIKFHS